MTNKNTNKRAPAGGRVGRGSVRDVSAGTGVVDARDVTIEDAVAAALRGETAAISRLPRDLQAEAQTLFDARADAQRRAELRQHRANPVHADPPAGLH